MRLGILSLPTCVGLRYGQLTSSLEVFLGGMESASSSWPKPRFPAGLEECGLPDLPGCPLYANGRTLPVVRTLILPRHPIGVDAHQLVQEC